MANYSTNEFKAGLKVMLDGDPCSIVENEFVKPGKGQAFNKVRYRNLLTGRVLEKNFRSSDTAETAEIVDKEMQYLYHDGEHWHFMDPESYEQHAVNDAAMGEGGKWIKEQDMCSLMLWNNVPISVTAPNFVNLAVTETEPGLRGDTSGGGSKAATLETGAVIRVPLFIDVGDVLRVDTRTGEYVSRSKE